MEPLKGKFAIFGGLLFLAIIVSILLAQYMSRRSGSQLSLEDNTETSSPVLQQELRPKFVPAGWQAYVNEEHGFALAYPANWNACPDYLGRDDEIYDPVLILDPRPIGCENATDWAGELVIVQASTVLAEQYPSREILEQGFVDAQTREFNVDRLPVCLGERCGFSATHRVGSIQRIEIDGVPALKVITDATGERVTDTSPDKTLVDIYIPDKENYLIFEFPNRNDIREMKERILQTIELQEFRTPLASQPTGEEEEMVDLEPITNWNTLEMNGWAVQYPPSLHYCGDTEGIPFCAGSDILVERDGRRFLEGEEQIFWFGEWGYRAPEDEESFGTCGHTFQECVAFFRKDGEISIRIIKNEIFGYEVIEKEGQAEAAGHVVFEGARDFFAELPTQNGILYIHQRQRSQEFDQMYEGILASLTVGAQYQFNCEQLGIQC